MAQHRPKQYPPNQQPPLQVKAAQFIQHSGPLPHPEVLRGFEEVQPGAADRIIQMAEGEATHRRNLENRGQRSSFNSERLGMVCAFLICAIALGGGFYSICHGHPAAGTFVTAIPLGGIVFTFIQGKKRN